MKNFLLKNQSLFKHIFFGFVCGLSVLGFSILLSALLYQPKKMAKRGFEVEIKTAQNNVAENIEGIKVNNLGDIKANNDGKTIQKIGQTIDIAEMIKNADLKAGEKIFKKCSTCHNAESGGKNKIGPNLYAIIGKKKASVAGFKYSEALKNKGGNWTIGDMNQWLTKPKDFIAGNKMGFAGLSKEKDRANVIAYLKQRGEK